MPVIIMTQRLTDITRLYIISKTSPFEIYDIFLLKYVILAFEICDLIPVLMTLHIMYV